MNAAGDWIAIPRYEPSALGRSGTSTGGEGKLALSDRLGRIAEGLLDVGGLQSG